MAMVYNWQLGRAMTFPYEEKHPRRQFAFVFNTNRCIGCQTCTMACKSTWTFSKGQEYMWWNNVESKPYGGYPQHWDAKLLAMLEAANPGRHSWNAATADVGSKPYGAFEGKTIFEAGPTHVGPEGRRSPLATCPPTPNGGTPISTRTRPPGVAGTRGSTEPRRSCPNTASGFSTWLGFAITVPTQGASPRAPARQSTSGQRTVSS